MMAAAKAWLRRRAWWVSFVVLLVAALVFSMVVGDYVARLRQPTQAGRTTAGQWADLSEFGFRARLDDVAMSTAWPSAYDPEQEVTAPDGSSLLRVRMSLEPLVDEDVSIGCSFRLFSAAGEQLTLREYGVEGPQSSECTFVSEGTTREKGVPFQSQVVYIVLPENVDSYSLQLYPNLGASPVYWTFTT